MARTMLVRVAFAAVLAIAMSARVANADYTCAASTAVCLDGYLLDKTVTFTGVSTGTPCAGPECEAGTGLKECCLPTLCTALSTEYCPYGYSSKPFGAGPAVVAPFTVEKCCDRDNNSPSFPVCSAASSGGAVAVQAPSMDDTNWAVQDNNGFARSVGQFTGMCFAVTINNDCSLGDPALKTKCCNNKAPSFLQFKLPGPSIPDAGTLRATTLADANVNKCRISYGTATGTARSLKRVTRWSTVGGGAGLAEFVNIPITWRRGQKTSTVCVYSNYLSSETAPAFDCSWENLCGFSDDTVPTESGSFANGCELRIVGRKGATTSACCAPTYSVQSFDATDESRLVAAAAAGTTTSIELLGN